MERDQEVLVHLFANPRVEFVLALGAVMAIVALAITIPAMLAEKHKLFGGHKEYARTPLETRVEYLELEIDALAVEIERVGESQRYLTRLMQATNAQKANSSS